MGLGGFEVQEPMVIIPTKTLDRKHSYKNQEPRTIVVKRLRISGPAGDFKEDGRQLCIM